MHRVSDQLETEVPNPELETLNSKQTQMSKGLNSKPIVEKQELLFEFHILDYVENKIAKNLPL
jgi:hypothetical protein